MNTMNNIFWTDDISILFIKSKLNEFIPTDIMTLEEKLNALMRFSIYLSLILIIYNKNYLNLYIIIITGLLTIFLYKYYNKVVKEETVSNVLDKFNMEENNIVFNKNTKKNDNTNKCIKPTYLNPFMNRLMFDKEPDLENCSLDDPEISEKIETNFNNNLYKDIGDIFNKNNSQRQYYTNSITSNPNDQNKFANWLYNTSETCKENNFNCDNTNSNIVNSGLNNLNLRYY